MKIKILKKIKFANIVIIWIFSTFDSTISSYVHFIECVRRKFSKWITKIRVECFEKIATMKRETFTFLCHKSKWIKHSSISRFFCHSTKHNVKCKNWPKYCRFYIEATKWRSKISKIVSISKQNSKNFNSKCAKCVNEQKFKNNHVKNFRIDKRINFDESNVNIDFYNRVLVTKIIWTKCSIHCHNHWTKHTSECFVTLIIIWLKMLDEFWFCFVLL